MASRILDESEYVPLGRLDRSLSRSGPPEYKQVSSTELISRRSSDSGHPPDGSKTLDPASSPPNERKRWWSAPRDVWAKEIASMVLSVGCMAAVFGVLISQDDKPILSWPFPWQPNSVVSFLSTIARAALIFPLASCISQAKWRHFRQGSRRLYDLRHFDAASRGPLGSLSFVAGMFVRSRPVVASLCCVLTVAALSMETFVQQMIDYPSRAVRTFEAPVCVAKVSQSYSFGSTAKEAFTLHSNMAKAIDTGIYGVTSFQPYTCPSGNCTWPDLTTLGVCSKCPDVTAQTTKNCTTGLVDNVNGTYCTYTTADGTEIGGSEQAVQIKGSTDAYRALTSLNITQSNRALYAPIDLAAFTVVKDPVEVEGVSIGSAKIFNCTLTWCARVFAAPTMVSGTLQAGASTPYNLTVDDTDDPQWYNLTGPRGFNNQEYSIFKDSPNAMQYALQKLFYGMSLTQDYTEADGSSPTSIDSLDFTSYLYASDSIPDAINTMMLAVTDFVRTINSVEVGGESYRDVTYVHVNWLWFIAPVIIELSAAVLLAASIFISNREKRTAGTQVWKDSVFPFLFNGLDDVGTGTTDRASEMEKRARQISVRLEDDGDGRLRFTRRM